MQQSTGVDVDADVDVAADLKRGKKRGNYNCGRCGQPKKGHSCHINVDPTAPPRQDRDPHRSHFLRRALSFDDDSGVAPSLAPSPSGCLQDDQPWGCLSEVLRRLPPTALLSAAQVSRSWRDCSRRIWRAAEELRLMVPAMGQLGFVGSVLQKCTGLVRLSLKIESELDAMTLACVAFSCPNLESLEIRMADTGINRITGDELSRFVAEKRCLTTLKIEGCTNLGFLTVSSSSLSTLWLSDLYSISKTAINCPKMEEISLDFSCQENDSTDLVAMVDSVGRSCPMLRNMHIASTHLSHAAVLSLTNANLRDLCMLSLILGSDITDASVAAIASTYENLELLDLSGSSISDSGIGMICNVFPQSLSRLLLALCPNITSSGIQFATAQLPLLQLIDCGMTICDHSVQDLNPEENGSCTTHELSYRERTVYSNKHPMYQKLIIKHGRLRKLSLWGCSGLDALYLNCPELNDLNLNSCTNLHPGRLLLKCPNLESVHASGCGDALVGVIKGQVSDNSAPYEDHFPCKRLADGSKRVKVPNFLSHQVTDDEKGERALHPRCKIHVS